MKPSTFSLLRWATCCIFIGWAGRHWLGETQYSTLLWDENWISPWVDDWSYYSHEMASASRIRYLSDLVGGFLLLCGLWALRPQLKGRSTLLLWGLGSIILLSQALLAYKEHFFEWTQWAEYSIQWTTPLLFLSYLKWGRTLRWEQALRWVVILTFVGHGMYAIGAMPLPVHFMDMTMGILNCSESQAKILLTTAGILDFLACILLLLPYPSYQKIGVAYMVIWGFLTAFARLTYALNMECSWLIFWHTWPLTTYRLAHGLLPWVLWNKHE